MEPERMLMADLEHDSELQSRMEDTLNATDIIQKGHKIKFRNLYCYHMEKIKNSHLGEKGCQNKVNQVFSLHSKLAKKLDPKTLTQKLSDLVNTDNIGGWVC